MQVFSAVLGSGLLVYSLQLFKIKTERQKYKQKTSLQSYKTQIDIHACPRLA